MRIQGILEDARVQRAVTRADFDYYKHYLWLGRVIGCVDRGVVFGFSCSLLMREVQRVADDEWWHEAVCDAAFFHEVEGAEQLEVVQMICVDVLISLFVLRKAVGRAVYESLVYVLFSSGLNFTALRFMTKYFGIEVAWLCLGPWKCLLKAYYLDSWRDVRVPDFQMRSVLYEYLRIVLKDWLQPLGLDPNTAWVLKTYIAGTLKNLWREFSVSTSSPLGS